jgi:hypothetical protein
MSDEELKQYNVMVGGGSGCFFQPMTDPEYTYILTSKHLFEGNKKDDSGNDIPFNTEDGTAIPITRLVYKDGLFTELNIEFILLRGTNYFPHRIADACILKVPFQEGFEKIFQQEVTSATSSIYKLFGYPNSLRPNGVGKKDTAYEITRFTLPGNNLFGAQLQNITFTRENVQGMSGGGILKKTDTSVILAGIQSEMASPRIAGGQIFFTPAKLYNEIVDDDLYAGKLAKLFPPYLHNFSFLREQSFALDVDAFLEEDIKYARIILRNKAQSIVDSDITPNGIKELFKEKLLIMESEQECFSHEKIWIAWLEFLTILNIVKYENITQSMLSDIFINYRLKYINIDDWTDPHFREFIVRADYSGLKAGANVFIGSRERPKNTNIIPAGRIIDISKPYDKTGFRTDKGVDPFTSFNFIHLDYFQTACIIKKAEQYRALSEEELLNKLKQEYNELFV